MIILATHSPRRIELMKQITSDFIYMDSHIDESTSLHLSPLEANQEIAYRKGKKIHDEYPNYIVIGADTIVVLDNQIIGKPIDKEDAYNILFKLNGREHEVITSYVIMYKDKVIQNHVHSFVLFNKVDKNDIIKYVDTFLPLDKAGAYGVQDNESSHLIKTVKGSINNVVGFPIEEIKIDLQKVINI